MSRPDEHRRATRRLSVLAVACLLVLSGCSGIVGGPDTEVTSTETGGPSASPTDGSRPTPTDAPPTPTSSLCADGETTTPTGTPAAASSVSIPVVGEGSLSFDVNRTYVRTMHLLGNPGTEPPAQVYRYRTDGFEPVVTDPFARTLFDARTTSNFSPPRGKEGIVMGVTGEDSRLENRFTVAHEMVHGVQFQALTESPAFRMAFSERYQRQRVGAAVIEGGASYAGVEYMLRYSNHSRTRILDATDKYRTASPAGKHHWAPYHFGQRYVESRYDSPAKHWCVYWNPPQTSEELIHGLEPGSEPVRELSVAVDAEGWTERSRETRGELFARTVLAAELREERAAAGAAGWGNDTLVHLERDDRSGFVWVVRWDTPADADEFRETFGAAMDARNTTAAAQNRWTTNGTAVRVASVAPETTVVVSGPESFVTGVEVSGDDENVTVAVGEN